MQPSAYAFCTLSLYPVIPLYRGLNAKAKFYYRSSSYALYRCRLSFTLLRLLPSKGGCATTLCTDLPSATFSNWHFYNQCLFNSFRQVIWLECKSKVSVWWEPARQSRNWSDEIMCALTISRSSACAFNTSDSLKCTHCQTSGCCWCSGSEQKCWPVVGTVSRGRTRPWLCRCQGPLSPVPGS